MSANKRQVAGFHYQTSGDQIPGEQHWDRQWRLYGRGYFVGCITKYVERYHKKNGKQDLEKAKHFLEKLIELEYADQDVLTARTNQPTHTHHVFTAGDDACDATPGYVNQDR